MYLRTLKYLKEGRSQTLKWGYQIEDTEERHEWFKLDLDPRHGQDWGQSDLASRYPSTTALPTGQGKSTEELVTDYLKALQEHVSQVLQQKLTNAVLHRNRVSYIITVPAVWSAMAQAKTRQCAEAAGMGRGESLYIISEPEAAAMYALDAMSPHDLEKGDTFVVCDAGGGYDVFLYHTPSPFDMNHDIFAEQLIWSPIPSRPLNLFLKFMKPHLERVACVGVSSLTASSPNTCEINLEAILTGSTKKTWRKLWKSSILI